jgi:hypothetical protein
MTWLDIIPFAVILLLPLTLIPFGDSGRSVADRISPRSAANIKNDKLG